jgi:branched-chain amino acid transport system substrate-binding protein
MYTLVPAIEQAGTLDPEKLIPIIENAEVLVPSGKAALLKDEQGRHLHDLKWGPGYLTSLGVQWQDGKLVGVWPNKWKATPEAPEITYKGIVPYKIPPWMAEKFKK